MRCLVLAISRRAHQGLGWLAAGWELERAGTLEWTASSPFLFTGPVSSGRRKLPAAGQEGHLGSHNIEFGGGADDE